jgi:hypothetical protein
VDSLLAAWVPCLECDEYQCNIHKGLHAFECGCPDIGWWQVCGIDPYALGSLELAKKCGPLGAANVGSEEDPR